MKKVKVEGGDTEKESLDWLKVVHKKKEENQ